jgi:hypothetical protein
MLASSSVLWTLGQPGVGQDRTLVQALYWLDQTLGGPGFSVPLGLLMAGVSVTAGFQRLLPKCIVVLGLALAVGHAVSGVPLADRRGICVAELE